MNRMNGWDGIVCIKVRKEGRMDGWIKIEGFRIKLDAIKKEDLKSEYNPFFKGGVPLSFIYLFKFLAREER